MIETKTKSWTKTQTKILRDFRKYDIWIHSMGPIDDVYVFVEAFPNTENMD